MLGDIEKPSSGEMDTTSGRAELVAYKVRMAARFGERVLRSYATAKAGLALAALVSNLWAMPSSDIEHPVAPPAGVITHGTSENTNTNNGRIVISEADTVPQPVVNINT